MAYPSFRRWVVSALCAASLSASAIGAVTFSFSTPVVQYSGAPVTVTISGVVNPSGEDVLAVYTNETIPYTERTFVKFIYLDNTTVGNSYQQTGSASYNFKLLNYHENYIFRFFKASADAKRQWYDIPTGVIKTSEWTLNGTSQVLPVANLNEIVGLHLIQAASKGGKYAPPMRAVWSTRNGSNPQLRYKVLQKHKKGDEASPHEVVNATIYTYGPSDMCNTTVFLAATLGFKDPYQLNNAIMYQLKWDTYYEYQVYDHSTGTTGEFLKFKTAPKPRCEEKVKIAIYGDMGTAEADFAIDAHEYPGHAEPGSLGTTKLVTQKYDKGELDMVVHFGDITYADGYTSRWLQYYEQIRPYAQHVPVMHTAGNHERDGKGTSSIRPSSGIGVVGSESEIAGGECGVPYQFWHPMPYPADDPYADIEWYSYEYGPIHFLVMSAEQPFEQYTPQWEFVKSDLASVDRDITPWLIVLIHRPLYTPDADGASQTQNSTIPVIVTPSDPKFKADTAQGAAYLLRQEFEYLFNIYKVDLVFSGHVHNYERSCQVASFEGPCSAAANATPNYNPTAAFRKEYVPYPNTPATGRSAPVYVVAGQAGHDLSQGNFMDPLPFFTEFVTDDHLGMTYMEVDRETLNFWFYDQATGNVIDRHSFELKTYVSPAKEHSYEENEQGSYKKKKHHHSHEKTQHTGQKNDDKKHGRKPKADTYSA